MGILLGPLFKSLGTLAILVIAALALVMVVYLAWSVFRERHPQRPYWQRQRERHGRVKP